MYKKLDDGDNELKLKNHFSNSIHSRSDDIMSAGDGSLLISSDQDEDDEKMLVKHHMTLVEIIILNMTYMGLSMLFLLLSVVVVPAQIEAIVGSSYKGIVLGITVALGAIVTFIIGPLVGMKSDRLRSSYGRRRPIILVSVLVLCISCIVMVGIAPTINTITTSTNHTNFSECIKPNLTERRCSGLKYQIVNNKLVPLNSTFVGRIWLYIPLYLVVISAYVSTITPYNALIADMSHPDQRGLSSGAMGGMILLGNIFGAVLGLLITSLDGLLTVSIGVVLMLVCVTVTLTLTREYQVIFKDQYPLTCSEKIERYWKPLKDNDFRWLFITRFLMQQGLTSVIGFLEYWINDMIELPRCWNTFKGLSYLLLPMLISAAISSLFSGIISDRIGKRKAILMINSFVMAVIVICMCTLRGPYAYYFAVPLAIIFGMSLGGYQSIDFALLMDIIPDEKDQSLMIAVWHQAMILPQALAVPISGLIVDLFEKVNCQIGLGYIILLLLIGLYFFLSGCFVRKIKMSS